MPVVNQPSTPSRNTTPATGAAQLPSSQTADTAAPSSVSRPALPPVTLDAELKNIQALRDKLSGQAEQYDSLKRKNTEFLVVNNRAKEELATGTTSAFFNLFYKSKDEEKQLDNVLAKLNEAKEKYLTDKNDRYSTSLKETAKTIDEVTTVVKNDVSLIAFLKTEVGKDILRSISDNTFPDEKLKAIVKNAALEVFIDDGSFAVTDDFRAKVLSAARVKLLQRLKYEGDKSSDEYRLVFEKNTAATGIMVAADAQRPYLEDKRRLINDAEGWTAGAHTVTKLGDMVLDAYVARTGLGIVGKPLVGYGFGVIHNAFDSEVPWGAIHYENDVLKDATDSLKNTAFFGATRGVGSALGKVPAINNFAGAHPVLSRMAFGTGFSMGGGFSARPVIDFLGDSIRAAGDPNYSMQDASEDFFSKYNTRNAVFSAVMALIPGVGTIRSQPGVAQEAAKTGFFRAIMAQGKKIISDMTGNASVKDKLISLKNNILELTPISDNKYLGEMVTKVAAPGVAAGAVSTAWENNYRDENGDISYGKLVGGLLKNTVATVSSAFAVRAGTSGINPPGKEVTANSSGSWWPKRLLAKYNWTGVKAIESGALTIQPTIAIATKGVTFPNDGKTVYVIVKVEHRNGIGYAVVNATDGDKTPSQFKQLLSGEFKYGLLGKIKVVDFTHDEMLTVAEVLGYKDLPGLKLEPKGSLHELRPAVGQTADLFQFKPVPQGHHRIGSAHYRLYNTHSMAAAVAKAEGKIDYAVKIGDEVKYIAIKPEDLGTSSMKNIGNPMTYDECVVFERRLFDSKLFEKEVKVAKKNDESKGAEDTKKTKTKLVNKIPVNRVAVNYADDPEQVRYVYAKADGDGGLTPPNGNKGTDPSEAYNQGLSAARKEADADIQRTKAQAQEDIQRARSEAEADVRAAKEAQDHAESLKKGYRDQFDYLRELRELPTDATYKPSFVTTSKQWLAERIGASRNQFLRSLKEKLKQEPVVTTGAQIMIAPDLSTFNLNTLSHGESLFKVQTKQGIGFAVVEHRHFDLLFKGKFKDNGDGSTVRLAPVTELEWHSGKIIQNPPLGYEYKFDDVTKTHTLQKKVEIPTITTP